MVVIFVSLSSLTAVEFDGAEPDGAELSRKLKL